MNDFFRQNRSVFRCSFGLDEAVETVCAVSDDWFSLARRNRVAALWAPFSKDLSLGEDWERYAQSRILHSARMADEAVRINKGLQSVVEDLCIVKGPALAVQGWDNSGLRSFDDLDFRCDKGALQVLVTEMQKLDYRPRESDSVYRENLWSFGWGISFLHSDGHIAEFNHRMFPVYYPWPARLDSSLLQTDFTLDQSRLQCPVPAMHLLLCSAHAVWHGWERLCWLIDIAGLIVKNPGVLKEAEALAGNRRFLNKALFCAAEAASCFLGPLPGVPGKGVFSADLIEPAEHSFLGVSSGISSASLRNLHERLMSRRESLCYNVRRVFTPGDPDFKYISLNSALRGIYWMLRPFRVLLRFLKK